MFCDWRMIPNIVPAVESAGFRYQNLVTWDKGHMGLGNGFRARHEQILHFTAGSPEYYAKDTGNVLLCKRVSADDREHQTQKPVELIAQLVRVVCPVGGTVLDPFAGSCTLAEACLQTGRNYICIERDPAHVATGESRILQTQPDFATVADVARAGEGGGVPHERAVAELSRAHAPNEPSSPTREEGV
jgi:site-specific DNA-methyltransferase (adenine-specific)